MKISDFLIQIVTVTQATKLKWDPYFTQDRIEQLIDTPQKAVSVILENGRFLTKTCGAKGPVQAVDKKYFREIQHQRWSRSIVNRVGDIYRFTKYHRHGSSSTACTVRTVRVLRELYQSK